MNSRLPEAPLDFNRASRRAIERLVIELKRLLKFTERKGQLTLRGSHELLFPSDAIVVAPKTKTCKKVGAAGVS